MHIIVYEDGDVVGLGPLAQTRPVFDLHCGAVSLLERQKRCFAADEVSVVVRPEMAELCRFLLPNVPVNPMIGSDQEVVLVNGRWLAAESAPANLDGPMTALAGGQIAFAGLPPRLTGGLTP